MKRSQMQKNGHWRGLRLVLTVFENQYCCFLIVLILIEHSGELNSPCTINISRRNISFFKKRIE